MTGDQGYAGELGMKGEKGLPGGPGIRVRTNKFNILTCKTSKWGNPFEMVSSII